MNLNLEFWKPENETVANYSREYRKMHPRFPVKTVQFGHSSHFYTLPQHQQKLLFRFFCSGKNPPPSSFDSDPSSSSSSSSTDDKFGFKLVSRSLRDAKWKFNDIDTSKCKKTTLLYLIIDVC